MKQILLAVSLAGILSGCNDQGRSNSGSGNSPGGSSGSQGRSNATNFNNNSSSTGVPTNGGIQVQGDDSTSQNYRESRGTKIPASNQSDNPLDHELARRIQDGLHRNPELASSADKVRVIAVNGQITLQGSVISTQQVAAIEQEVKQLAGTNTIQNVLEVRPDKTH